jgi:hypothetical protein
MILLDGASSHFYDSSKVDALSGLASNTAGATLTVRNGYQLTTSQALTSAGAVMVGATGTITVNSAAGYTQTGGSTQVNGQLNAGISLNGGTLRVVPADAENPRGRAGGYLRCVDHVAN